MSKKNTKSLNFRKGNRTLKQFKKDIKSNTAKEEFLMNLAVTELKIMGYSDITFTDNGINNVGDLIEGSTGCASDYIIFINGEKHFVEIKNSKSTKKCTFKVYQLQEYVKQWAHIFLFYGTGPIKNQPEKIDKKTTRWAILSPQQIQTMLDKLTPYKDYYFGNKLCIQVQKKDFLLFWTEYKIESWK